MRRWIPLLVLILAVQIGLTAVLALRKNPLAATTPQTPLIGTAIGDADRIIIDAQPAKGTSPDTARVELTKQNGQWVLANYFNTPVEKSKVSSMLDELTSLKRGLPVGTSSSALKRFKVVDDAFERRLLLSQGGKTLATVYFGSAAGVHKSDARTAQDHAVYNVDLATYELSTQPSDWFDGDLLQRDTSSLTELDITPAPAPAAAQTRTSAPIPGQSQPSLKLVRQPVATNAQSTAAAPNQGAAANAHGAAGQAAATAAGQVVKVAAPANASAPTLDWVDANLPAGRVLDGDRIDQLTRDVGNLHVDAVLGVSANPEWQQDHPLLTLSMADDKHPGQFVTWTLSKPLLPKSVNAAAASGTTPDKAKPAGSPPPAAPTAAPAADADYYVLKDSGRPWYFKVSATSAKQLLDDSAPAGLLTAAQSPSKESAGANPTVRNTTGARKAKAATKPTGT